MTSFNLLNIGKQALQANKTALTATGQNISNVNTPGYSRQRANFQTQPNLHGVQVSSVERIANEFLTRQVWTDNSVAKYHEKIQSFATELDNVLGSQVTGLSAAMNKYFAALQNSIDDPTSIPNRKLFLAEARTFEGRMTSLHTSLTRQRETINEQMDSTAAQINTLAASLAKVNQQIVREGSANTLPDEVLDQRDQLVEKLSAFVDVNTIKDANGVMNVYIGEGQPLVVGDSATKMLSIPNNFDPTKNDIALDLGEQPVVITNNIKGGSLGAMLSYRESTLANAANELGRIAIAFADTMNKQQQKGMDLDNNLGGLLFKDINSADLLAKRVSAAAGNSGPLTTQSVQITDTSKLKAAEYRLKFNTEDGFTIQNLQSNQSVTQANLTAKANAAAVTADGEYYWNKTTGELTIQMDGFKLRLDSQSAFAKGDEFRIQPVYTGAQDFKVVMTDERKLAFAAPVVAAGNTANTGDAKASVVVTDANSPSFTTTPKALTPPVDIVFSTNAGNLQYAVYPQGVAQTPANAIVAPTNYTAGSKISWTTAGNSNGYEISFSKVPASGDRFTVGYNTNGASDNRNALLMSGLKSQKLVGGQSYSDVYGGLVGTVGNETALAKSNASASASVLKASIQNKTSVSGVNLDEEAANLIQFQQAYNASARLISVSQTIFDNLLQAVR